MNSVVHNEGDERIASFQPTVFIGPDFRGDD